MRRRFVAAAWIAGATVPLLMATVFIVGCCVLPFHDVMHRLMPVCAMAERDDECQRITTTRSRRCRRVKNRSR